MNKNHSASEATGRDWHLAQPNVGRTLEPLDSERLKGFVDQLDVINALADSSTGFVWRIQDEAGSAINILPTDDPQFITNLSVWTSLESLAEFVYRSAHTTGSWNSTSRTRSAVDLIRPIHGFDQFTLKARRPSVT